MRKKKLIDSIEYKLDLNTHLIKNKGSEIEEIGKWTFSLWK